MRGLDQRHAEAEQAHIEPHVRRGPTQRGQPAVTGDADGTRHRVRGRRFRPVGTEGVDHHDLRVAVDLGEVREVDRVLRRRHRVAVELEAGGRGAAQPGHRHGIELWHLEARRRAVRVVPHQQHAVALADRPRPHGQTGGRCGSGAGGNAPTVAVEGEPMERAADRVLVDAASAEVRSEVWARRRRRCDRPIGAAPHDQFLTGQPPSEHVPARQLVREPDSEPTPGGREVAHGGRACSANPQGPVSHVQTIVRRV